MMKILNNRSGITLVEILVAISLFGVVVMITANIMINVAKIEKRSSVENAIYEDLRFVMQRLTDEIQNGAIDYEEYYSRYVLGDAIPVNYYGMNYGVYGSRFYNPGKSSDGNLTINPTDLGVECTYPDVGECEIIYALSADTNTGQNPFYGDATVSNAFCDYANGGNLGLCNDEPVDELFLIDKTGTKKTIIGRKKINGSGTQDYSVGMVEMEGTDIDQNGIVDTFECLEKYSCDSGLPLIGDLEIPFNVKDLSSSAFVPISPLRSSIKGMKFIITPKEDPYKAYAEVAEQMHPSVTIILTIGLSQEAEEDYPGEFRDLTVQTTVSAGVLNRIDSYPPINDIGTGWIDTLLPDPFNTPYPD